jgi:glycosyltransferase involved in cell wall biosynthesis
MNLNMLAPINQLGYGVASLNILRELVLLGHDVALFPIGGAVYDVPVEDEEYVKKAQAYANFYDPEAPSLRVWQQNSLAERVGRGKLVGFPFFELLQLKMNEVHHMERVDRLVVASRWAADVCEANGLERPTVAPLGVDRRIFHESVRDDRLAPDHTIFVNVGKWEIRKGHDVLIKAFNKAFDPGDKVILKFATHNPFIRPGNTEWEHLCHSSRMGKHIHIYPHGRMKTQQEVAKYLATADCAVFPARAEGWNLELLEAMSCGIHCIATNVSAHTEFVDEANCRLIHTDAVEDARDGIWFHGQGQWAALGDDQMDQLIHHMREVHRLKQTGQLGVNARGIETSKIFNWRATAEILAGVLA